ncbi:MAG: alpha-glycosidase, partial [Clostridiales bacterium]|nr:alpha-glycosidase [Clostridiales bacterium]
RTNGRVGRTQTVGPESASEGIHKGIFKEAVVMQMTWVGAPTIYYGDESGVCGWTDPDNRRTYPWGQEDQELIAFHRDMIRIHKSSKAWKRGSLKLLYGEYGVIVYSRFLAEEKYIVIVNNHFEEKEVRVPVWQIGVLEEYQLERMIVTTKETYSMEKEVYDVNSGEVVIKMLPISACILKAEKKKGRKAI